MFLDNISPYHGVHTDNCKARCIDETQETPLKSLFETIANENYTYFVIHSIGSPGSIVPGPTPFPTTVPPRPYINPSPVSGLVG